MVEEIRRWSVRRLDRDAVVSGIDFGDEPWGQSVTEFLIDDALEQQQLLASKTTLFYYDQELVGFATLVASSLELQHAKAVAGQPGIAEIGRDVFPSVLIARFGVHKNHQRSGYSRRIFDWVLADVVQSNIGARFLILHVEKENRGGQAFWSACGFRKGSGGKRILMWLDLYPFVADT